MKLFFYSYIFRVKPRKIITVYDLESTKERFSGFSSIHGLGAASALI